MWRWTLAAAALLFLLPASAHAHACKTREITLTKGEIRDNIFLIEADLDEVSTDYTVLPGYDTKIVKVTPQSAKSFNFYLNVEALEVGQTTISVRWDYKPSFASGICTLTVTVVAEATSTANNGSSGQAGDPVNTKNGELFFTEPPDLEIQGPLPLVFERYYASEMRRNFVVGRMGDNWRHNFEWTLKTTGNILQIENGRGRTLRYIKKDTLSGKWEPLNATDVPHEVVQVSTGDTKFHLLDPRTDLIHTFGVPTGTSAFKLERIEDGKGNALSFTYNGDGDLTEVSDGRGRKLSFFYDTGNAATRKLIRISDGTRSVQFTYAGDNLSVVKDVRGFETTYFYDDTHATPGLLTMTRLPEGNIPFTQTFDSQARVATQEDAAGNVTTFTYTGLVTDTKDPAGAVTEHEHDEGGSLVRSTDAAGKDTSITNDAAGRRSGVSNPGGGGLITLYDDASGKVTSEEDANGNRVEYVYDTRTHATGLVFYDLTEIRYPDGTKETFERDGNGNVTARTDRAGNRRERTVNGRGQVLTEKLPTGSITVYTYDSRGNRATMRDPAGNVTTYTYDGLSRLTRITHADGTHRDYEYDAAGHITRLTDERGKETTFLYDQNGDLVRTTDPAGESYDYTYDGNRRLVSVTDRVGATFTRTYDARGEIRAETQDDGEGNEYTYDTRRRITGFADRNGESWSRGLDDDGRLTSLTDPRGATTIYEYDAKGEPVRIVSPLGNETRFAYDAMGRVTGVTDPLGQTTEYTFDANGWLKGVTLPGLRIGTVLTRNALSEITEITDPGGRGWKFVYDAQGRLTGTMDPLGQATAYEYDARNRVSRVVFPGALGDVRISYNGTGHATRRQYSDGTDLLQTYDDSGRPATLEGVSISYDAEGRITKSNGLAVRREAATGRITAVVYAPGRSVTYEYTPTGRLRTVTDWRGGSVRFLYDAADRLASIERPNGVTSTFTYDDENRVLSLVEGQISSIALTRDRMGRVVESNHDLPLHFEITTVEETFAYDAAGQVTGFIYDTLGRVTDDGVRTYAFDLASRLTSYDEGGKKVSFTHNGYGHLLTRTEGGVTTEYVWNHALELPSIAVERVSGADVTYYVHGPDGMLLASIDAATGARRYYHYDERGNTLFLTNDSGQVVVSYAYSPWGLAEASPAGVANPFTFGGRFGVFQEGSTGLFIMRQRIYDQRTRRFLSREPVLGHFHPLSVNPYAYARGNPLRYVDPMGHDATDNAINTVGSVGGATGILGTEVARRAEHARVVNRAVTSTFQIGAANGAKTAMETEAKWNRLDRLANGRVAKAVGHLGTGVQILSIGLEMNKLRTRLNKTLEDYDIQMRQAVLVYAGRVETVFEIYRKKKKTLTWLEAMLHKMKLEMELEFLHAEFSYDVNFMLNVWTSYANGLGSFVPGFTGLDPDAGKNVGFFNF